MNAPSSTDNGRKTDPAQMTDLTEMLQRYSADGDANMHQMLPLVYDELRALASRQLARQRPGHTLQPTALINEAYLRLAEQDDPTWEDRREFLLLASTVMRRVLVDYARRHNAAKRPTSQRRVDIDTSELDGDSGHDFGTDLVALDQVLENLAEVDPRQARVVELRYFAGLSMEDTADTLQISKSTVVREWRMARAWLKRNLD
jgi:RNA polymerase sigma factor (TIGR02999 family)